MYLIIFVSLLEFGLQLFANFLQKVFWQRLLLKLTIKVTF